MSNTPDAVQTEENVAKQPFLPPADYGALIAAEIGIKATQAAAAITLLDEGNTVPFIARYRKEMTGSLDDEQLRNLSTRLDYLRNLDKRKEEVAASIIGQEKMTDSLAAALIAAKTLAEVEDLYRPFKQKRKTRASVAKEKGLEPLAQMLFAQEPGADPNALAADFISEEKGVPTAEEALQGAMDILAEQFSDDADCRKKLRVLLWQKGMVRTVKTGKEAEEEKSVYTMYYDYTEPVQKIPGHRILAINRGEKEDALKVDLELENTLGVAVLTQMFVQNQSPCGLLVAAVCQDSFDRLIFPSLEREMRSQLTETATASAIGVFGANLRQLLMQPPIKGHVTLGLDPAYRTGCKIAVVDETGKVLDTCVVYPTPPQKKMEEAKVKLLALIKKYNVTLISIGNGTASRESEDFVAELVKECDGKVGYVVVSEAGASVYSASKLGAEEFPDFDVTQRSAVSIARRLQDPLPELVKIDPKSIGVGQYQHDMPKAQLDAALGGVVEGCVNSVGVDLNTASAPLLTQVAGINSSIAKNIVQYREANGAFKTRKQLLKVPKLGQKAFEQAAGFLRVTDGSEPLDATAVHPESYEIAKKLLAHCGFTPADLTTKGVAGLTEALKNTNKAALAKELGVGEITLNDIINELQKPGRDPREALPQPVPKTKALKLEELEVGMELQGTVRNVIDFGAFVDIGVHDDGLVHISQICNKYIKHPSEVLKVGDVVKVKIINLDVAKHRVGLTMKGVTQ